MSEIMDEERKHEPQIPRTMAEKAAAWDALHRYYSRRSSRLCNGLKTPSEYEVESVEYIVAEGIDFRARLESPEGYVVGKIFPNGGWHYWGFIPPDGQESPENAHPDWGRAEAIEAAWEHYDAQEAGETDDPEQGLHPRCNRPMQEATLEAQRLANATGVPARVPWLRSDGVVCYASASPRDSMYVGAPPAQGWSNSHDDIELATTGTVGFTVYSGDSSISIPSHMDAAEREWDEGPCEGCGGQGWWAGISSVRHTCERCGGAG